MESEMLECVRAYASAREVLENAELELRAHYGGDGSGPYYVVYFTEQEAFNFIRAKLEATGLDFSAKPPEHTVELPDWDRFDSDATISIGIDLYDAQREIGVVKIPRGTQGARSTHFADQVSKAFAEQFGLRVEAFVNPGESIFDNERMYNEWYKNLWQEYGDTTMNMWEWGRANPDKINQDEFEELKNKTIAEREPQARQALIDNLTEQVERS
jgi:hypothetical protein